LARPIVLIPHLFQLAGAISFRKDYSPPSSPPSRPFKRRAVLEAEAMHGSPPDTVMIGGQRVRISVRDPTQEDLDTETEAEAQVEGSTEGQQQEQPLRRSTRTRT